MITKELTALFILAILPALASHCQAQRWHYVHFLVVNTSSMPCLYLPLHPSIILTSPSSSPFSFLFSLISSLCTTSIHLFFSIPLQLLFLILTHFLFFFLPFIPF